MKEEMFLIPFTMDKIVEKIDFQDSVFPMWNMIMILCAQLYPFLFVIGNKRVNNLNTEGYVEE